MADKWIFAGNALIGGGEGALDSVDTTLVPDRTHAYILMDDYSDVYFYIFDAGSSTAENVPNVIAPDTGTGRWLRVVVDLDNISDGSTYARVLAAELNSGTVKRLDDGIYSATVQEIEEHIADIVTNPHAVAADDLASGQLAMARMPVSDSWVPTSDIDIDSVLYYDQSEGRLGVNIAAPLAGLHIVDDEAIRISDNETNNTDKTSVITGSQYASDAEPEGFALIGFEADNTDNRIRIGGGFAGKNSATDIRFSVADDPDGVDTNSMQFDGSRFYSLKQIRIGADSTDNAIDRFSNGSGSDVLYIGNKTIDTTVVSDGDLKANDVDLPSVIDKIKQLRVVEFNFIGNPEKHVGMIAQEVQSIFPELVKTFKMIDGIVTQSVEIEKSQAFVKQVFETTKANATRLVNKEFPTGEFVDKTIFVLDDDGNRVQKTVKRPVMETREVRRLKPRARLDEETGKFYIIRKVLAKGVTEQDGKYYQDREVTTTKEYLRIVYKDLIPYMIKAIQEIAP